MDEIKFKFRKVHSEKKVVVLKKVDQNIIYYIVATPLEASREP